MDMDVEQELDEIIKELASIADVPTTLVFRLQKVRRKVECLRHLNSGGTNAILKS